ncbi:MAG TPA: c-type cytochrome [Saprospiraceae bacterium]|nr:c-type cytochrome [Saprospiraceae bacterium]HND86968.1 c-type cytochrome [Saprospiraceae bacterium]
MKRICWIFTLVLAATFTLHAGPTAAAGKELFIANCASCHNKNMKDNLTGPALGGVEERWAAYPRKDLYAWIRNSQASIASGQPRAVELWAKYKPVIMNNFTALTDEQIESMLLHINEVYTKPAGPAPGAAVATDTGTKKDGGIPWLFIGIAVMLGLLAFALMRIVDNLQNYARVRDGKAPSTRTWVDSMSSKGFIAFTVFALTLIFGYKTVDNAARMGRTQDYQPDQPINFSHRIHAGQNKIDCQYCHDSARRSKHSSIPAANTCMNCHAAVKKGTISGTSEITKIYASIGFDPISSKYIPDYENWTDKQIEDLYKRWIGQEYISEKSLTTLDDAGKVAVQNQWDGVVKALKNDSNGKIQGPIEWVRIHNLADHAYFNHSQHVSVGQIACQKCHGPVEQMDVVYQYSTLGMGWCISCHRETEVKFKDNAYYQQYARYHQELKDGKREKVTVEDIGGLECQKCHY